MHSCTFFFGIQRVSRGSRSLQNLVAICQPLLTIKAGCNGKNWLLNPESNSQSEGYSSKWLIWLVVREPLVSIYICELGKLGCHGN